ncbi:transporter protein [Caballeronia temeraria]|uniref:Transporter protein n=1 Tax=Caballeronia temeraria TaxID=1777137 RepID=A0A158CKN2_9BURK|nr:transporter protein [Caballeronia temeraria]
MAPRSDFYIYSTASALVFGHLGDRGGRKKVLVATLVIMGVGTVGIGFLPTYATAGALAPALLILLRVAQAIAPLVRTYADHGGQKRKG